jgi:outer membrane lipoprotein LolB
MAACASTPPPADSGITSGRLSLRVDATAERTAQSLSAGFELQGSGERGELRLISPLGTQLAAARWAPGEAQLTTSDGTQQFAGLQALSRQALGEDVPLAALPDWLAGRPWPGAGHTMAPEGFEQLGWQVNVARRADGVVEARRAAPPVVLLRVRLELPAP